MSKDVNPLPPHPTWWSPEELTGGLVPGIRGGEGNLLQHLREAELLIMKMKIEGEQQNRNGLQGPANIGLRNQYKVR